MSTQPPVAPPAVDDRNVSPTMVIEGIPPLHQGTDDLLCGYCCIRMIRAAASVDDDSALENRRKAERWDKKGLAFKAVAEELRRVPGWEYLQESRGRVEAVWTEVAQAARCGRPSVLWLPETARHHPWGHYVVVVGIGTYNDGQESEEVLLVQDPMHGRRWSPWREWTAWRSKRSGTGSKVRAFIAPDGWRA